MWKCAGVKVRRCGRLSTAGRLNGRHVGRASQGRLGAGYIRLPAAGDEKKPDCASRSSLGRGEACFFGAEWPVFNDCARVTIVGGGLRGIVMIVIGD